MSHARKHIIFYRFCLISAISGVSHGHVKKSSLATNKWRSLFIRLGGCMSVKTPLAYSGAGMEPSLSKR